MTLHELDQNGPIFGQQHFAQRLLTRYRAFEAWDEFIKSNSVFNAEDKLSIEDYESEQIAGLTKITNEQLIKVWEKVNHIKIESSTKKSLQEGKLFFDNELAKNFHNILPLAPSQGAKIEIWLYLSVRLFPDIIYWRWADNDGKVHLEDRVFSRITDRHALARLWWQSALLNPDFLTVKGDTRDQISERGRTLLSRPLVANAILEIMANNVPTGLSESELIKSLAGSLTRKFALIPVDLLSEEDVKKIIKDLIIEIEG